MLFAPKHRVKDLKDCHLTFKGNIITSSDCTKRIQAFILIRLCQRINKSVHSRDHVFIKRIRPYINEDACKTLVNSFIISRLDYGIALLYGLPACVIQKLQRVRNTAARVITRKKNTNTLLRHLSLSIGCLYNTGCNTKFNCMFSSP